MVSPEGTPLSRRYFAPADERMLEWDEIVRGYEIEKDRFVVVTDDELERIAPERTRDIDLRLFVDVSSIDPMHFERAYYLTPAGGSNKAYRLLARVMEETGRAGIATFVMRGKEYLVAILAERGILRAETLRFADELRTPESIGLPEPMKPKAVDVKRIEKEIAALAEDELDLSQLADTQAERMEKLVASKKKRKKDVVRAPEEEEEESRDIIDLMQMLQRSLKGAPATEETSRTSADDLNERSKAELYEQAQELDIPGRSGMTKDELIRAIGRSA
jgi:DNA end-binding protein Ku